MSESIHQTGPTFGDKDEAIVLFGQIVSYYFIYACRRWLCCRQMGREQIYSSSLFSALISFAPTRGLKSIVLDTPSVATRSHAFYRRAGFRPISKEELPVPYEYPDRNSLLFMLVLQSSSIGG